tara:strand:+ start:73 stop:774 length:702 start_codon:yes stop_codon:yes gene_type:complete
MFSIVIPLFNESKNIKPLIYEIENHLQDYLKYEIVLVNDASTDKTKEIIKSLEKDNIKIFNNLKNKGQSFSIHHGITQASYETIITLDGDGQNNPIDITKLLNLYLSNNDLKLVGGKRHKRQDNIIKIYSSKIANYVRSKILNDNCEDTGCSLKVFSKQIFLSFPFFDGIHRFLPALFSGFGYKTAFINVGHRRRKYGVSKYGIFNRLFRGIRDIIKVYRIIKNYNNKNELLT